MSLGGMGITPSPLGEHFSIIFEWITDVLNFSYGLTDPIDEPTKRYLAEIKQHYEKSKSSNLVNSDKYLFAQWAIEYIDNGLKWVMPSILDKFLVHKWNSLQKNREALESRIAATFREYEEILASYVTAMKDNIFSRKDYFLAVVAAGNNGQLLQHDRAGFLVKSADMVDDDPIIGVAAGCSENYAQICPWSNCGDKLVDILASGENILVIFPVSSTDARTTYASGTSLSAPLVTGTIALLAQCEPTATVGDIKRVLFESAEQKHELDGKVANGRILNIETDLPSIERC